MLDPVKCFISIFHLSRIERKYCAISTSYLTELECFGDFSLMKTLCDACHMVESH